MPVDSNVLAAVKHKLSAQHAADHAIFAVLILHLIEANPKTLSAWVYCHETNRFGSAVHD